MALPTAMTSTSEISPRSRKSIQVIITILLQETHLDGFSGACWPDCFCYFASATSSCPLSSSCVGFRRAVLCPRLVVV